MALWKQFTCDICRGFGVVTDYENGSKECDNCNGGALYVSDKDRLAAWPGGPFLGYSPGKFNEVDEPILVARGVAAS